ncbi:hypothetical protein G6F31_016995 [Rhizopus arrhizus]|nr:hypothetical protein G6F31_016995 [Rhizopus arrhizus]
MWAGENGGDADAIIDARGLKQISDTGAIGAMIDEVLAANPAIVEEYRAGKQKAFNSLVGQIMKAARGKANPQQDRPRRDCHDRDAVGLGHVLHRRMRRQRIVRAGAFHAVHGDQHGGRFGARAADDLNGFAHRRACRDHVVNDDDLAL